MSEVTIQDVARAAGVSAASVSNLLNGRMDRMRPVTRARIEAVILELGYRPNPIARQLKTGRAPMFGLLVPNVANPFYGELAVAVERFAQAHGYHVLLCNTLRDGAREREFTEQLASMGVQGLIIAAPPADLELIRELVERRISIAAFDIRLGDLPVPGVDVVTIDNDAATRLAVNHLADLGHRNIAFASAPVTTANRSARLHGYHEALRERDLSPGPILVGSPAEGSLHGDVELGVLGQSVGRRLAALRPRPTAVVAHNDMLAIGVMSGLNECGVDVPRDVSVVGLDDIRVASLVKPALTTIRQPSASMAEAALNRLVERLAEPSKPASELVFLPELVKRASTAPPSS